MTGELTYKEISSRDIKEMAAMYVETFNAPPWNDKWTIETAGRRLSQMINVEDFFGLCAYQDSVLCGMILGCKEQFYDCMMFNIREFCIRNALRGHGLGTLLLTEFETRLKQQGVRDIILNTSRDDGTEGFYNRRGLKAYSHMVVMGKEL